jgi:hypothetical protein
MRERGNQITTEDILKNHRDICWAAKPHEYGSITANNFPILVRRYLFNETVFTPQVINDVLNLISQNHAIFILAAQYVNPKVPGITCHAMRVIGGQNDELHLLVPGLPYGYRQNATLNQVQGWAGEFRDVSDL